MGRVRKIATKAGDRWQLDMQVPNGKRFRRTFPTQREAMLALHVFRRAADTERKAQRPQGGLRTWQ
jgi:hypothetical protein